MKHPRLRALVPAPVPAPAALIPHRPDPTPIAPLKPVVAYLTKFMVGNTKRAYSRDLADFFRKDIDNVRMPDLLRTTPADVANFRDELLLKKLGPGTIARKISALRGLYIYHMALGTAARNPASRDLVQTPKRSTIMKTDGITWNEAISILRLPDRTTKAGRRDYTLLLLDMKLGLRRSELVSLKVEDIKPGPPAPYLRLRGKGQKDREIPLRTDFFDVLRDYHADLGSGEGYLFPSRKSHLSGTTFWRIVTKYARTAGLSRVIHPHSLRAAFVTFCIQDGVPLHDIQYTVGHSRPETTLGYARRLERATSRATRALDGLSGDAPFRDETPEE